MESHEKVNLNGIPYVSKEENTFIHDKKSEEYAIERLREKQYIILSKHSMSDFSDDLKELLKLQLCIEELQAIANRAHGISYINKFGGNSYSESHLQMMNEMYDELNKDNNRNPR